MSFQRKYNTFRMMFPEFIYESFIYDVQSDGLHISFTFSLRPASPSDHGNDDALTFRPTAFIPARRFLSTTHLTSQMLDTLVFNIGMIELVSYWKAYCPPTVVVKPFSLSDKQVAFWKKIYYNGLGEFFYTNGIRASIDDFMKIRCESEVASQPIKRGAIFEIAPFGYDSHIVPIGGGKDSVVTLQVLGADSFADPNFRYYTYDGVCRPEFHPLPLIMNPRGATTECVKSAGYTPDDVIVINRTIDPLLLEFNKQGALNGHTPFSAMLAFYTLLASAMTGSRPNIALSNENSANESTVAGSTVNHQYSKSLEFENDFRTYVAEFVSPDINYYSFLRPLSELQIAALFAQLTHYHEVFRSCNVGSKQDVWCGHCAKCLFAYIILSPFISPEKLDAIFGKCMLDDMSLRREFDQLTGREEVKPFECVGTVSEVRDALTMTIERWYPAKRPALLQGWEPAPLTTHLDAFEPENNLPPDDVSRLKKALNLSGETIKKECTGVTDGRTFSPEPIPVDLYSHFTDLFNFFLGKRILIAGYGREGQSTEHLLRALFPNGQWDVAKNDEEIVAKLSSGNNAYDMVIKSPGIPMSLFDTLCPREVITSQSDIFLRFFGRQTIGITGTKGKSTTSSLIASVLSSINDSWQVILAGNIGVPLFDIITRLTPTTTVVAELSCHQLENISVAPSVGILLNLFEEHLDHYRDYADYCNAKMQIALRQQKGDTFYYCTDNADLATLVEKNRDKIYSAIRPYSLQDARNHRQFGKLRYPALPLIGDHNFCNAFVAWLVAEQKGLSFDAFEQALSSFAPLPHRLQPVGRVGDVDYFNDSISTIPQATIEALKALGNVQTLILGGFDRGIDYSPLARFLVDDTIGASVRNLVLFGSAGRRIHDALLALDGELESHRHLMTHYDTDYSMKEAVDFAATHTDKGRSCLLSPAASSYDHYKNFEFRGNDFAEIVRGRQ